MEVVHHFYGGFVGVWLAFTLLLPFEKGESFSLPYSLLILGVATLTVATLAQAFLIAYGIERRLDRIKIAYKNPLFYNIFCILGIYFATKEFGIYKQYIPQCGMLFYLLFILLAWVGVFEIILSRNRLDAKKYSY